MQLRIDNQKHKLMERENRLLNVDTDAPGDTNLAYSITRKLNQVITSYDLRFEIQITAVDFIAGIPDIEFEEIYITKQLPFFKTFEIRSLNRPIDINEYRLKDEELDIQRRAQSVVLQNKNHFLGNQNVNKDIRVKQLEFAQYEHMRQDKYLIAANTYRKTFVFYLSQFYPQLQEIKHHRLDEVEYKFTLEDFYKMIIKYDAEGAPQYTSAITNLKIKAFETVYAEPFTHIESFNWTPYLPKNNHPSYRMRTVKPLPTSQFAENIFFKIPEDVRGKLQHALLYYELPNRKGLINAQLSIQDETRNTSEFGSFYLDVDGASKHDHNACLIDPISFAVMINPFEDLDNSFKLDVWRDDQLHMRFENKSAIVSYLEGYQCILKDANAFLPILDLHPLTGQVRVQTNVSSNQYLNYEGAAVGDTTWDTANFRLVILWDTQLPINQYAISEPVTGLI